METEGHNTLKSQASLSGTLGKRSIIPPIVIIAWLLIALGYYIGLKLTFLQDPTNECSRLTSPDGKYDAVLVKRSFGATAGGTDCVFVVPAGLKCSWGSKKTEKKYLVFSSQEYAKSMEIQWSGDKSLAIKYARVRYARDNISFGDDHIRIEINGLH